MKRTLKEKKSQVKISSNNGKSDIAIWKNVNTITTKWSSLQKCKVNLTFENKSK